MMRELAHNMLEFLMRQRGHPCRNGQRRLREKDSESGVTHEQKKE